MAIQKTEAVVLRSIRQGETSKVLHLYTRAFGKMAAIAKGARSARSKFGGSLEPLNYIALVFYRKENRDLQVLSQAEILEAFPNSRRSLGKTAISLAVCELVDRLELEGEVSPRLFRLLLEVLRNIDKSTRNPANHLRYFLVRLLEIMGFQPNLRTCLHCQQPSGGSVVFDIVHGGYVCAACRRRQTAGIVLSEDAFLALQMFHHGSFQNLNGALVSPEAQRQVDETLFEYLRYHLEGFRELKSLRFYNQIRGRENE